METRAVAGIQEMKEEDIADDSKPTASSTLSKGEMTAMSKFFDSMAF